MKSGSNSTTVFPFLSTFPYIVPPAEIGMVELVSRREDSPRAATTITLRALLSHTRTTSSRKSRSTESCDNDLPPATGNVRAVPIVHAARLMFTCLAPCQLCYSCDSSPAGPAVRSHVTRNPRNPKHRTFGRAGATFPHLTTKSVPRSPNIHPPSSVSCARTHLTRSRSNWLL